MSAMPILDWVNDPVDKLRNGYAVERAKIAHFSAPGVSIEVERFASGKGLKFTPSLRTAGAAILYFHGGGWIAGSPWTHQTLCSWMAKFTGRQVFSAPYVLAPEYKFPAQADQAAEITNQFTTDRDHVILSGDSAGGAMVLWAAASLREPRKVQALVSLYGAYGSLDGPSHVVYGHNSHGLQTAALCAMYGHLGCEDTTEFRARLSTSGAPLLLVKAECDPIADDNDWLAQNTNHPVTHLLARGQPHAYLQACGSDRLAEASMQKIADWIKNF